MAGQQLAKINESPLSDDPGGVEVNRGVGHLLFAHEESQRPKWDLFGRGLPEVITREVMD